MTTIDTRYRMAEGHAFEITSSKAKVSLAIAALNWLDHILEQAPQPRRALLEMSDEQLKDIGISRADAYREGHIAAVELTSWPKRR